MPRRSAARARRPAGKESEEPVLGSGQRTNRNTGYLHHNDGYYDRNVRSTNCVSCSFDRYMSVFEMTVWTNLMDSPSQTDAFLE